MELIQLLYFREVARLEHVTVAAGNLHVTQPTLSRSISSLEEELGVSLFSRQKGKLRLNQNGKVLLEHVERMFMELSVAEAKLKERSRTQKRDVSICCKPRFITRKIIGEFALNHPEVCVHQVDVPNSRIVKMLESADIEFAICFDSSFVMSDALLWESLFVDGFCAVTSSAHPLAGRKEISLADIKDERFIINNSTNGLRDDIFPFCCTAGFSPNVVFESNQTELIFGLARQNFGIVIQPESVVLSYKDSNSVWAEGLSFVPISDSYCKRTIGIVRLKGKKLSANAESLYRCIVETI